MRKYDIEKDILLAQSGELSPGRLKELEKCLSEDADAVSYRGDLDQLCAEARSQLSVGEPSAATMERVLARAAEAHPHHVIAFPAPVVRLAACAAALALMVGSWLVWLPGQEAADPVSELRTVVALVSTHDMEVDVESGIGETEQIRALAHELLIMQGLAVDEDATTADLLPVEPEPTGLRWRSNPASPSEIYG